MSKITKENYNEYVKSKSPKTKHLVNTAWAFTIGGLICVIGQLFIELYLALGCNTEAATVYSSATMIILSSIATGFGVYDLLGRFAGAGSTVPITGYANAIVAPAIEFRAEGMVYGMGAKMFSIAGPVLVNGVVFSSIIAFLLMLFGG